MSAEAIKEFPAIMHDPVTTIPVIIPALDYADAVQVADRATAPGQLWAGFKVIVLGVDAWEGDHCRYCADAHPCPYHH